jgi:putative PIN family toxin of toxin-antitoxin system
MIDTNVIISAALFPNAKMNRFLEVISEDHGLFLCSYSLDEVERVVKRKFPDRLKGLEMFLQKLRFTLVRTPSVDIFDSNIYIRDPKDYPILISAIIADVDALITGDKDFESLDLERPEIPSISEFEAKYL